MKIAKVKILIACGSAIPLGIVTWALMSALLVPVTAAPGGSSGFAFDLSISPAPGTPGAFLCEETVKELDGGRVVASPRALAATGEEATVEATDESSGTQFTLVVRVDKDGRTATYGIKAQRAGKLISQHDAKVQLAGF